MSLLFSACSDSGQDGDNPPVIDYLGFELYKNATGVDSLLRVRFAFEDIDGDLGLEASDTFPPFDRGSEFQFNLWVNMYDLDGGGRDILTIQGTNEPLNLNQRIPLLTPAGKNKSISGEMSVDFDASELVLHPDRVECEILVIDRALNKSNLIGTGPITLTH